MKNRYLVVIASITACLWISKAHAQDDLIDMLEQELIEEQMDVREKEIAIFKGTRLILGHTTKTRKKGELEMLITHRFGKLSSGPNQLWGLDNSSVRIGFGLWSE